MGEEHADEDEGVLQPLMRPDEAHEVGQMVAGDRRLRRRARGGLPEWAVMRFAAEREKGAVAGAVAIAVQRQRAEIAEQRLEPAHLLLAAAIHAVESSGGAAAIVVLELGRRHAAEADDARKGTGVDGRRRGDAHAAAP